MSTRVSLDWMPCLERRASAYRIMFTCDAWAPAGTGKRGHLPPLPPRPSPAGNVVLVFCALVVTATRSVDELFMHYFHNLSSASGLRVGAFVPRPLICPPLEKILQESMLRCCNRADWWAVFAYPARGRVRIVVKSTYSG